MKQVRFLSDYRGVLTGELYFVAGQRGELPDGAAFELRERGLVELVDEGPEPDEQPAPEPLDALTVKQLRKMARAASIPKWHGMKKDELVKHLRENNEP
jgi:hypothetical protein